MLGEIQQEYPVVTEDRKYVNHTVIICIDLNISYTKHTSHSSSANMTIFNFI